MQQSIQIMKRVVSELEKAAATGNKVRTEALVNEMMDVCVKLKQVIDEKKSVQKNIRTNEINEISFLYKPVLKRNYYEGTYLEEFAQKRTSDLKDAKALDSHNKFWQTHEVIRGNVFGSVPEELIHKDAARKLMGYGWDRVSVIVLEIKQRDCSMKEFAEYCELNFDKFLIVREKSTGAELILHYKV
ncbi:hypothetical protein [Geosporobacter ferrireducens]|uniref:Uncharacterized protein n=1 Tax=Geosporobacter ferrireducens TaxID=1424294 RepID=A0A1D8GDV5_9FIRM|nr:hypothetical protein [Geosporobacter ferrireducens]AOT69087.1 hypothetical protein Gferi_05655 [Geosporobacter ferrireducens]MTI56760.1 hypothetical protein [Geosporobacter ferrireducens]